MGLGSEAAAPAVTPTPPAMTAAALLKLLLWEGGAAGGEGKAAGASQRLPQTWRCQLARGLSTVPTERLTSLMP